MALAPSIAKQIVADFLRRKLDHIVERDHIIPTDIPKIISLLGPRRAGKTSICLQLAMRLREEWPGDQILYVNFGDDRFYPPDLQDMDTLIKAYYELYPQNKDQRVYFFFDEVQEIDHWEKFIRRVSDQENCQIFLIGSSSKLLSREIATSLRGRTLPFEILPLSFHEFLRFNNIEIDANSSKGKAVLQNALLKYLQQGGFPELVFLPETVHRRTVSEYIDLMLYKDLTERFAVRNPRLLKYLLKYVLNNISNLLSVNKIFKDLKSQGYSISKNTVYDYLSYLEEAFILFRVRRWSLSERQQEVNPDKLYCIDPTFKYVMGGGQDRGRILENMVFLHFRRYGFELHYWQGKQEVDFYVDKKLLLNVCYDLSGFRYA